MKKSWLIPIALLMVAGLVACSSSEPVEPAPEGNKPEIVQASPDQVPPEQRVRQRPEGSEGDAD